MNGINGSLPLSVLMLNVLLKWLSPSHPTRPPGWRHALVQHYQILSSASVDDLWRMMINVSAIASWHPLISNTNLPQGLVAKPGLIYSAVTWFFPFPIPIRIFVECVRPQELLSIRVLSCLGFEEQVTYQIESTLWGTQVSYSVEMRGWLSRLIGSLMERDVARVVSCLAHAAEALPPARGAQLS